MTSRTGLPVHLEDVTRTYEVDGDHVTALADVGLEIGAGESVAIFGPSGSGKSTLMSLVAGLQRPSSGTVWVGDSEVSALSQRALLRVRGERIGMVLQNPSRSLLPYGTAAENIRFAQRGVRFSRRGGLPRPKELLTDLGLGHLAGKSAGRLSGGEQQRLSIAVAMATSPGLLLADEPTSQLDEHNRDLVAEMLARVNADYGTTLVVVTHDPAVADAMGRRVVFSEGRMTDDRSTR